MNLRDIYEIKLGNYKDKYMVTVVNFVPTSGINATLRRVRTPKSKIDGVRLPNEISITFFGRQLPQQHTYHHHKQY